MLRMNNPLTDEPVPRGPNLALTPRSLRCRNSVRGHLDRAVSGQVTTALMAWTTASTAMFTASSLK